MKIDRNKVYVKCGGRCAYCGKEITLKQMQVDHIEPQWTTVEDKYLLRDGITRGTNHIDNLNPACVRCNKWKSTFSVERFRGEISKQAERLQRDSSAFRMALDYNLISIHEPKPIVFYFEILTTETNSNNQ